MTSKSKATKAVVRDEENSKGKKSRTRIYSTRVVLCPISRDDYNPVCFQFALLHNRPNKPYVRGFANRNT